MRRPVAPILVAVALVLSVTGAARADGITQFGDGARTGSYPNQPALTRDSAANDPAFGPLFSTPVNGQVFGQPLLADGTLIVATEENQVYGLDPVSGAVRWQHGFGTPFDATAAPIGCLDVRPHVGVTATPVIDSATHTAYMTSKQADGSWRLHALDIATGSEQPGFPVVLAGAADNAPGVSFNSTYQLGRPALLLLGGTIYAGFGSHCDAGDYRGWVFGVSTAGGANAVRARWTTLPDPGVQGAGVWQSGAGLASDGPDRIFLTTGNGYGSAALPPGPAPGRPAVPPDALGEAVVSLRVGADGKLRPEDFFTPTNAPQLDGADADFGSGGPIVLPPAFGTPTHPNVLAVTGKDGRIFVLDRNALGGYRQGPSGGDADVFDIQHGGVWGKPSLWTGDGGWLYVPTSAGYAGDPSGLDFYRSAGNGSLQRCATSDAAETMGLGTSSAVVTSNGTTSGSALAWVVGMPTRNGIGAQLKVFDATPTCGSRPRALRSWAVGTGTKYAPPGVGDGRIYVGTLDGHVLGFGRPSGAPLTATGSDLGSVTSGTTRTADVTVTANMPVNVTGATVDAGTGFALGPFTPPSGTLTAGDTFTVPVSFTSPDAPGAQASTLRLATSSGPVLVTLTAQAVASTGYLLTSPSVADFGGVAIGHAATTTINLENGGGEPLTIGSVTPPAGAVTVQWSQGGPPLDLAPGARATVTLTYAPTAPAEYASTMGFATNGSEPPDGDVVHLTGRAVAPGHLDVSPASVAFGNVFVGQASSRQVVLRNTGGASIALSKFKPPAPPFSLSSPLDEAGVIQGGQAITSTVRFAPTTAGVATGAWTLTANDGGGPHVIGLTGASVTAAPAGVPRPLPPAVAPRLTEVRLLPNAFRAPRRGGRARTRRGGATRMTIRVSARCTLRVRLARRVGGRLRRVRGSFPVAARRRTNVVRLTGRMNGRPLPPGRYVLIVEGVAGRRIVSFRVTPPRRPSR